MGYVNETLRAGEEVICRARFHWTYSLTAFLYLLFLGIFIIGIFIFLYMMIRRWTTEIAVTTDRLIYKRGWIARQVDEVTIDKVEGCSVQQSVFGRILGYGAVTVRGVGIGEVKLPVIARPIRLRKAIAEAQGWSPEPEPLLEAA